MQLLPTLERKYYANVKRKRTVTMTQTDKERWSPSPREVGGERVKTSGPYA